jgi:hypothetical protein
MGATDRVAARVVDDAMSRPPATLLHIDNNGHLQIEGEHMRRLPQMVVDVGCAK